MSTNYFKKIEPKILFSEKSKKKISDNSSSSIGTNSSLTKNTMLNTINKELNISKFSESCNLSERHKRSLSTNGANSIGDIISFLFQYEYDIIKHKILKYLIQKEQMDQIEMNSFRKIKNEIYKILNIDINDNSITAKFKESRILNLLQTNHDKFKDKIYYVTNIIKETVYNKYYSKSNYLSLIRRFHILKNYKKHCFKCPLYAKHKCKNFLYITPDSNYIICKFCQELYAKDQIECYCDFNNSIFISYEYNSNSKEEQFYPITYKDNLINEMIKCEGCNNLIEINMKNGKLTCNNCDIEYSNDINAIIYNSKNFERLKIEIEYILLIKEKVDENEINENKKCDCGGDFYIGNFNLKDILVCGKCNKVKLYKKNTNKRLQLKENIKLTQVHSTQNIFRNHIFKKLSEPTEKKEIKIYHKIPPINPKNLIRKRGSVILDKKIEVNKKESINNLTKYPQRDISKLKQRIEQKPIYQINNSVNNLSFLRKNNTSNTFNMIKYSKINKILNNNHENIIENNNKLSFNLNMSDYRILHMIGNGSFANIYLVSENKTNEKYAVKKIIVDGEDDLKKFKKTIEIIQNLCPNNNIKNNIIPILKYTIKKIDATGYSIYILMPLASCDWNKKIKDNKIIYDEKSLREILISLVNGFSYMQKNKICHRDIKPKNILIIDEKKYCIADFDESINVKNDFGNFDIRGTENYMSPILKKYVRTGIKYVKHNVYKSDVYSLGLCFVYAITKNIDDVQNIRKFEKEENIKNFLINHTVYQNKYSDEFYNILIKMLSPNERYRVDFNELKKII